MTYIGLSGSVTGISGMQAVINEMNSHNLNVLRLVCPPSWYPQGGTTASYSPAIVQYFLDNCGHDIIVDRNHIWNVDLAVAAVDFKAHLQTAKNDLVGVCNDFPANPRVLIELCNEYNAADNYPVMQDIINYIRGQGHGHRIVQNWYGYAYPYRWTLYNEPVIQGNHIYFDNPPDKTAYAQSIMQEAEAAGIEVINTEIGAATGEYPQFTAAKVQAVTDFLAWAYPRGIGNCVWYYRNDVSNMPYYYALGFQFPTIASVFTCPTCGLTFNSQTELDTHILEVHTLVPLPVRISVIDQTGKPIANTPVQATQNQFKWQSIFTTGVDGNASFYVPETDIYDFQATQFGVSTGWVSITDLVNPTSFTIVVQVEQPPPPPSATVMARVPAIGNRAFTQVYLRQIRDKLFSKDLHKKLHPVI